MKRVDTVAEIRTGGGQLGRHLYHHGHGDVLSVGDLQCVLDFLVLYIYN